MDRYQAIDKLNAGAKLFRFKRPATSGNSIYSKIIRGKDVTTYNFDDGTKLHYKTAEALLKAKIIIPGTTERTLGGTKTELVF